MSQVVFATGRCVIALAAALVVAIACTALTRWMFGEPYDFFCGWVAATTFISVDDALKSRGIHDRA